MAATNKLTTCLWFDTQAEEAANHYISIFPNSSIASIQRYNGQGQEVHGKPAGTVMTVEFVLMGTHRFVGLNGGPHFKHTEAVSFMIECADQAEVDYYWDKIGEGGDEKRRECGWIADKFGVSWQVVPKVLKEMLADPDEKKAGRAMAAMMGMKRMDIEGLKKAFEGVE
ncbi:hypothetical protein MAPG_06972 [Magnaporthiopsis poae ATCC 64411]|uniref:PhnB-like domain-containing protein n=1 Tax=Magnaporthiopsis poae (strain ATCC 64411 / 73-15) TaxID=644358 RepID=A0A0C4E3H3_MAGP6|nr:hypothetical protein MAPG_06972 [Magnaporthiopsis poae ATCC 64411]